MNQEQILEYISNVNITDLDAIKKMIEEREAEMYEEAWWTHETIDDYLYKVHYQDGHTHITCKGADSYREYIRNDDAVWIERYTKDLFPTYEFLMRKEQA